MIEPASARSAALAIDARRKAALKSIAKEVDVAERGGDPETFMERDRILHLTIERIGGNHILTGFTGQLLSSNVWLWFSHLKTRGRMKTSELASHQEIVAAIVIGNADSAAAAKT